MSWYIRGYGRRWIGSWQVRAGFDVEKREILSKLQILVEQKSDWREKIPPDGCDRDWCIAHESLL